MKGLSSISRFLALTDKVFLNVSIALIIATVLLMNAEVAARYLMGFSILISDEYSGYFFAASTMLCLLPALREGRFIRIEGLVRMLPYRVQAVLEGFAGICGAAISGVLAWQTWNMVQLSYDLGTTSLQASQTPQYLPQIILPIGFAFLCIGFLEFGFRCACACWRGSPLTTPAENDYVVD